MSASRVAIVLHGWSWPDGAAIAAQRAAAAGAFGAGARVIEARERRAHPMGAAALVNQAVCTSDAPVLVVIEAGTSVDASGLAALADSADAGALTIALPAADAAAGAGERRTGGTGEPRGDLLEALGRAIAEGVSALGRREAAGRPRAWAVRRDVFDALGGLDPALWHVGELDDLLMRARTRGVPVVPVACAVVHGRDAYPIPPTTRAFLGLRHRLLSAWQHEDVAALGRTLALLAGAAVGEAWRAAAIDVTRLRFGGTWGRRSRFGRAPGRPNDAGAPWPADEAGTLVPLLALDAFLGHVTATTAIDRHRRLRAPVDRPHEPAGAAPVWPALPSQPLVSVIVVNWNGREHLDACFASIAASDYPADRLEVICVDNGSTDGSRERLRERHPSVRVVALDENRGFTGGNEAGVAVARGDVLVFFNNDMRVAPDAISALVGALDAHTPAVAARVLDWAGRRVDFVRGTVNFEARGFQERYGETDRPEWTVIRDTFFPNGGAFAVTRAAYDAAGGFDPAFFAYYDDVDLGWRLRLAGAGIRLAPDAVVYHRHGATSGRQPAGQKRFLMERNALWTALKNYGDDTLGDVLGPMLLLAVRRLVAETDLTGSPLAVRLAPWLAPDRRGHRRPATAEEVYGTAEGTSRPPGPLVRRLPIESLAAVGSALDALPEIAARRARIQRQRVAGERDVLSRFGRPLDYTAGIGSSMAAHDVLVERLRLADRLPSRSVILLVTHEPLREHLSGPGVRVVEMARALSDVATPIVATPYPPELAVAGVAIVGFDANAGSSLRRLAEQADVIVVQGFMLARFPFLGTIGARLVVDLYCPFTIEHLQMKTAQLALGSADALDALEREALAVLDVQNGQLAAGDFFICASERQRDFWIGALHTAGRINARTYADDETLRALVDVVPFGLPSTPIADAAHAATAGARVMRGVRPGIGPDDRVLLWGGSVLDWQDPQTLVRAVALVAARRTDVKLFFMGTRHPNPDVPPMRAVDESRTLARDLGVLDTHVFFNDWVPYRERAAYLAEADLGVSTHREHLETRLSFRTRLLDYLWARLPVVCSDGDHFAVLVREHGLGLVVPPGDAPALAGAITRLLDDQTLAARCRAAIAGVAPALEWRHAVAPLRRYVRAPWFAADRATRLRTMHEHLARGYRLTKWAKRTALSFGATEGQIEEIKQWRVVRTAMGLRNRVALARAKHRGRLR